jgi:hypothetical protein
MVFWMKKHMWKYEVMDVKSVYPDAKWKDVFEAGYATRAWLIDMDPIPHESDLNQVIADLNQGMDIEIGRNGKLFHAQTQCKGSLEDHPILFPGLKLLQQVYKVELTYRRPYSKAIASTQPKARILNPEISGRTFPFHPHMYGGKTPKDSWACPLSPQQTNWGWGEGATVKYLDQVAIWILKTIIWAATGSGIAGMGKWIGPQTPHDKLHLLKTTGLNNPCWCGSGIAYKNCHLQTDAINQVINSRNL